MLVHPIKRGEGPVGVGLVFTSDVELNRQESKEASRHGSQAQGAAIVFVLPRYSVSASILLIECQRDA